MTDRTAAPPHESVIVIRVDGVTLVNGVYPTGHATELTKAWNVIVRNARVVAARKADRLGICRAPGGRKHEIEGSADKIVGQRIARVEGRDGLRGPTVDRIVLADGTELRFDWTRGDVLSVGLNVLRTEATVTPKRRRLAYGAARN